MAEELSGEAAIKALFDEGMSLKNSGNQIEALKKF